MSNQLEELCDDFEETTSISGNMVYITGPITQTTISPVIAFITAANIVNEHDCLVIFINSEGGSLTEGMALVNVMAASTIPIITIAIGECCSAGLMIAMSGNRRYVGPDTSIMSHQYSAGIGLSKHTDLKARVKDLEITADRVIKHYMRCTALTEKEVKKMLVNDTDVFLTPQEAVKLNLFDDLFTSFDQILCSEQSDDVVLTD